MLKQLTIFLENKKGSLTEMTRLLSENSINSISFTIAETSGYGLMRMIVDKPEEALKLLKENTYSASLTDVLVVEISTNVGTLNKLIEKLEDFDIEYLYVYSNNDKISGTVLKINAQMIGEAIKVINDSGYNLVADYCI